MLLFDIFVLLGVSFLGSRLKGFGMGVLGGSCVLLLMCASALHPTNPPCDIVLYIASIVGAVGAVEAAGGFSYVIRVVGLVIKKYPGSMVYISPLLTYMITFLSGTNHIAYSVMPIIAEVSRSIGVRPSYPLSLSVISALFGALSSPVSSVALIVEGTFSEYGIGMATIFKVLVCSTLGGLFTTAAIFGQISKRYPLSLDQQRCQDDNTLHGASPIGDSGRAISSVALFSMGVVLVILMSSVKSLQPFCSVNGIPQYVPKKYVPVLVMFAVGMVIKVLCRLPYKSLTRGPIFTAGVQGMFSIFGMAWLSSTVIEGNKVYLVMNLTERHKLSGVNYIGIKNSEESKIKERITLLPGQQVTDNLVSNLRHIVEKYFKEKGYYNIAVKVLQRDDPEHPNFVILDVTVERKDKIKIISDIFYELFHLFRRNAGFILCLRGRKQI